MGLLPSWNMEKIHETALPVTPKKIKVDKQKSPLFILRYDSNKPFPLTQRCYAFGIALYAKSIKTTLSHDCPKILSHPLSSPDNWGKERMSPQRELRNSWMYLEAVKQRIFEKYFTDTLNTMSTAVNCRILPYWLPINKTKQGSEKRSVIFVK